MINHIVTNLVTKGLLNISNITKGLILVNYYEIVFRKRGGFSAGVPLHYDKESLYREIQNHNEDDIELIKIYVDWNKFSYKDNKKIEAKLLKIKIEAEILKETSKNITVEIIN